jgi:hypothetical protein
VACEPVCAQPCLPFGGFFLNLKAKLCAPACVVPCNPCQPCEPVCDPCVPCRQPAAAPQQ